MRVTFLKAPKKEVLKIKAEKEPEPELISVVEESEQEPEEGLIIAPPEQKPSIFVRFINLSKAGFSKIKYVGWWVLTRNYLAFAKNTIRFVLALNIWIKILLIIIALIIILIIWTYYFRDTKANNLRKARKHHKKGEAAHGRGDEEDAEYHYTKAAEYRKSTLLRSTRRYSKQTARWRRARVPVGFSTSSSTGKKVSNTKHVTGEKQRGRETVQDRTGGTSPKNKRLC